MKPLRHIAIAALIGMGISNVPSPATAAPNCPPQYQEICKQLIKVLEDNNDGKHFYQWDPLLWYFHKQFVNQVFVLL